MGPSFVKGLGVAVTATVTSLPPEEPDTIIAFSGQAYPSTEVTVRRDGESFLSTPTNILGAFDVSQVTDPGQYTFSISGRDADSLEGPVFNVTLELDEGTATTVSGIFLGPTIETDKMVVPLNDTITISGTTVPHSKVSVHIAPSPGKVYKATAGADGRWSKKITATAKTLPPGAYTVRARATAPDGAISEYSRTLNFVVTEEAAPSGCAGAAAGDIDCNGTTDLSDLSILLYYWNSTNVNNRRADINGDGVVNMVDFSILLYYWTD